MYKAFAQDGKSSYPQSIHTRVANPWEYRKVVHRGLWITSGTGYRGVR